MKLAFWAVIVRCGCKKKEHRNKDNVAAFKDMLKEDSQSETQKVVMLVNRNVRQIWLEYVY